MNRKVVVTGMGVITSQALHLDAFSKALKDGVSGEGPITRFDLEKFPVKRAFEVKGFDPHKYRAAMLDPFIQYVLASTAEAVLDSGLDFGAIDPFRIGIAVSSSKGGVHSIWKLSDRFRENPSALLAARVYANMIPNFAAQWLARRWKIQGPAKCYVAACATGTVAVAEGARMVADGVVDYCIAGASDAAIVPLMLAGYYNMKAMSRRKMTPFDKNRGGFLVGEGAGIVILETLESAKARGAKIYGEILGSSYGSDGSDLFRFSEKENALANTIQNLLRKADIRPGDIDYVNLHGTATKSGDIYETGQIKKGLGKMAYKIPMSAIKSMTGHMMGASGAVEVVASLLALTRGFIPPTIGLENPDPACDLNYTPNRSVPADIKTAITLSMGFGGHIAALALRKI